MVIPGIAGRIGTPSDSDKTLLVKALEHLGTSEKQPLLSESAIDVAMIGGTLLSDGGVHCGLSGNVDWLHVEYADIQLKKGPAAALLHAYQQLGIGLLDAIGGRFACFIWDKTNKRGLIACDRFGQMPVYWALDRERRLVFGPTATTVTQLLGHRSELSDQGIFNYLYFHMVPGPDTIFSDVSKLMAAHALIYEDENWKPVRYWQPSFDEYADTSLADAGEEMLGLLGSSVARLAEGADVGAFLSGGLDSSTVAGLLAKHRADPETYSIGFDAEGYDEIEYARMASERFGTRFNTYYVTPEDVLSALPKIAAAYDEPFGNSSALPVYFCARFAAADGRERLLAGDGGDELFAGNERYAKQTIFEHYGALPKWLRHYLLEPLVGASIINAIPRIDKARSYIRQANIPLPDRLRTYNFLNRFEHREIFNDDLWQIIDPAHPSLLEREIYESPPRSASRLNRMLYLDWHHTLTDNDLRKVNRMCQLAGIDVEYPMLDDRLVDFSTRVSSSRKMRRNKLRDFYKRAVKDFLPEQIIDKPKHGFGLPFGVWMSEHPGLQELAADNLSRMKRRRYIKPAFLDRLSKLHLDQHSGYYGEFIWVLMMLELWLTAQGYEP